MKRFKNKGSNKRGAKKTMWGAFAYSKTGQRAYVKAELIRVLKLNNKTKAAILKYPDGKEIEYNIEDIVEIEYCL